MTGDYRPFRLHNRVAAQRIAQGLTQAELAQRAGLSPRLLSKVESVPGYWPSLRTAIMLCRALGAARIDDLWYVENPRPRKPRATTRGSNHAA